MKEQKTITGETVAELRDSFECGILKIHDNQYLIMDDVKGQQVNVGIMLALYGVSKQSRGDREGRHALDVIIEPAGIKADNGTDLVTVSPTDAGFYGGRHTANLGTLNARLIGRLVDKSIAAETLQKVKLRRDEKRVSDLMDQFPTANLQQVRAMCKHMTDDAVIEVLQASSKQ